MFLSAQNLFHAIEIHLSISSSVLCPIAMIWPKYMYSSIVSSCLAPIFIFTFFLSVGHDF